MESGTFNDFLAQMPLALVRLLLIFLILIVMAIVGYVLAKRREIRRKHQATPPTAGANAIPPMAYTPPPTAKPRVTDDGMPDLDTLLAMTEPPAPPVAAPANGVRGPGLVTVQMSSGGVVEAAEVLILARDRATNRLIVQIGDHAYSGAEAQIDPEFRRQFVALMKELSGIAPQLGRGTKAGRTQPTAQPAPGTPPMPDAASPAPASGTLAGQIEARLQAKLRGASAFRGRSIHVMDAADGGVAIEVDGEVYDGVNAVADDAVRELIAGVVAEWQESL